jgi:hypothetical protein
VFAEFVLSILTELPRFHDCYNQSANLYRSAHGIRSSAHPVPNLGKQGDWLEAPLWIYGNESPIRRGAWVKLADDHLLISDRHGRQLRIQTHDLQSAAAQLAEQLGPEFKIRPRALLTTMYARTVLSDLFLHGIGGAKYDQLGDMIVQTFFGIRPPEYMVISATVHLPGIQPQDYSQQIAMLKRSIRDTLYQPERFADLLPGADQAIERKFALLDSIPPHGQRSGWHDEITKINRQLADQLQPARQELMGQLNAAQRNAASQAILESREHPFCVFPLQYLSQTFERLLQA